MALVARAVDETAKGGTHRPATFGSVSFKKGKKTAGPFLGGRPTLESLNHVRVSTFHDHKAKEKEEAAIAAVAAKVAEIDQGIRLRP